VKAIGNQWYWSYEYSDYLNAQPEMGGKEGTEKTFDSFMVDTAS
jgi:heme/copper-type cytochrome/quinol oxidase subunit 2